MKPVALLDLDKILETFMGANFFMVIFIVSPCVKTVILSQMKVSS
jgi:hypothetical protein